jgi:hypothetical protein
MTDRAQRFRTIRDVFQKGPLGDQLAEAAFKAEAAIYGVTKPFSEQKGVEPAGTKPEVSAGAAPRLPGGQGNPWSASYGGSPEQRLKAQIDIIKSKGNGRLTGTQLAADLALHAVPPVAIDGKPLRPTKGY